MAMVGGASCGTWCIHEGTWCICDGKRVSKLLWVSEAGVALLRMAADARRLMVHVSRVPLPIWLHRGSANTI